MYGGSLNHRGSTSVHIPSAHAYDPESDRKKSGAGLEDVAKNPTTWISGAGVGCIIILILCVTALGIVFGISIYRTHGKIGNLQDQVNEIQAKGTPGACYDGCSELVELCTFSEDCTALLVPEGTVSTAECYYGMCVYLTVPPAFPVPAGVLADDMCVKFLNHTDEPRLSCLATSTTESSDMASYCMFLNGCGEYVPPPIILRGSPEIEDAATASPAEEPTAVAPEVAPAAPAARSVRRSVRK
jgi:hypothetical protein